MSVEESSQPLATVLINTKDRKEDLKRAIDSVYSQTVPVDLIVVDDGSTDGTSELVRNEYPAVKLVRNEKPLGIIAARNQAVQLVETNILFTLDDDAEYSLPEIVEVVLSHFDHPRVGAVAIPLRNHVRGTQVIYREPCEEQGDDFSCSSSYSGGANALRVDLFRKLGGYKGSNRQAEERTFSVRLMEAGYVVRIASLGYVDHYPNETGRNLREIDAMHTRNGVAYAWMFVPMPWFFVHLAGVIFNSIRSGLRSRTLSARTYGFVMGVGDIFGNLGARSPVSGKLYRFSRKLLARERMPFSEVESYLPEMA